MTEGYQILINFFILSNNNIQHYDWSKEERKSTCQAMKTIPILQSNSSTSFLHNEIHGGNSGSGTSASNLSASHPISSIYMQTGVYM